LVLRVHASESPLSPDFPPCTAQAAAAKDKFAFLLAQTEIFAHFLSSGGRDKADCKKCGAPAVKRTRSALACACAYRVLPRVLVARPAAVCAARRHVVVCPAFEERARELTPAPP
jgi:hypothetical protein